MTLCATDKVCGSGACDQVIRGKTNTSPALHILHDLLKDGENMRGYAARCLQLIAEDPVVGVWLYAGMCVHVCVCVCTYVLCTWRVQTFGEKGKGFTKALVVYHRGRI
jgi:hypothetical protein